MMRRDQRRLGQERFDLLVIGGGICGAWTAYEASLRGLKVALVERDDWGAGTSSASSKLIHGGLRYLETGQISLVARSLRERTRLMALAPHRVHALDFLLPVYPDSRTGRLSLIAGLTAYDHLSGTRPGVHHHRYCNRARLLVAAPFLGTSMRGGFSYSDAGSDDARFTLEIVAGALHAGAVAINHAAADHLLHARSGSVSGALVVDQIASRAYEVQAQVTVNAAGPWAATIVGTPRPERMRLSKGVHLVMPPLPEGNRHAILLTAVSDKRVFFLIPWYGATLLGTTDSAFDGDPSQLTVTAAERDYLLAEVQRRCPALGWREADIRGSFAGVRVLQAQSGRGIGATSREWRLDQPRPGLLVPIGGKFTSARVESCRIVDQVQAMLRIPSPGSATARRPFPWCPNEPWDGWLSGMVSTGQSLGLDAEVARTAACRFGTRLASLHERVRGNPALAARIHPDAPFCLAELGLAVAEEMALDDRDVLRRRVPIDILARLDESQQQLVSKVMDEARQAMVENPTYAGRESDVH
jgi:glycerol-3-phosphate dehydrogenase